MQSIQSRGNTYNLYSVVCLSEPRLEHLISRILFASPKCPGSLLFSGERGSIPWVKQQRREVNNIFLSSAEDRSECRYNSNLAICFHGVGRENFTITLKLYVIFHLHLPLHLPSSYKSFSFTFTFTFTFNLYVIFIYIYI
jgi:hypothetical protein